MFADNRRGVGVVGAAGRLHIFISGRELLGRPLFHRFPLRPRPAGWQQRFLEPAVFTKQQVLRNRLLNGGAVQRETSPLIRADEVLGRERLHRQLERRDFR